MSFTLEMDAPSPHDFPLTLTETLSLCGVCRKVVPATLFERNGDVRMRKVCSEHGESDVLHWKDARLYRRAAAIVTDDKTCPSPRCARGERCDAHLSRTYTVMIPVTQRCDFGCPVCLAAANENVGREPSPAEIAAGLPTAPPGINPNACLIGGEPTLRDDLPDLVRAVRARGYIPRLNTNGWRLGESRELRRRLREAGLRWVILQFDALSDDVYEKTRGRPLAAHKIETIGRLQAEGFKVQLAVMLVGGVNLDEIGRIVRFALEHGVFWVSFYPHSSVNRNRLAECARETHVAETLDAFDRETAGRISRKDFLDSMRWLGRLYRLTGREEFRQKLSTWPIVVVGTPDDYTPATRFLSPLVAARRAPLLARLGLAAGRIVRYGEKDPPRGVLFVNVEKFHGLESIDLREASRCHMCYLTSRGLVAFDMYNILHRGAWEVGARG